MIASIEDPVVIKRILDHLGQQGKLPGNSSLARTTNAADEPLSGILVRGTHVRISPQHARHAVSSMARTAIAARFELQYFMLTSHFRIRMEPARKEYIPFDAGRGMSIQRSNVPGLIGHMDGSGATHRLDEAAADPVAKLRLYYLVGYAVLAVWAGQSVPEQRAPKAVRALLNWLPLLLVLYVVFTLMVFDVLHLAR